MRLPISAFLDDYNLITCTINRSFNEGKADRFTLLSGREALPLPIEEVREEQHRIR